MGVGLFLQGTFDPPAASEDATGAWLGQLQRWLWEFVYQEDEWSAGLAEIRQGMRFENCPGLMARLHPAAEDVEFLVPASGQLVVSAKTSTVGAGYHTALCDLLHKFAAEFAIRWDPPGEDEGESQDETGYFDHGDRAAVQQAMLDHLKSLADISIGLIDDVGQTLEAWHLPVGHNRSEYPGQVHTPLGPRSESWLRDVSQNPSVGTDILPWPADSSAARVRLSRALCGLWTDVCWRPPLDESEGEAWGFFCEDLVEAYRLDPSLDYPWREWLELIEILNSYEEEPTVDADIEAAVREQAARVSSETPLIGYRRYPARADLSHGWSIRIPGAMTVVWEENIWSAWDGQRTVWFSHWIAHQPDGSPVSAAEVLENMTLEGDDLIFHENADLIGKAMRGSTDENGIQLQYLKSFSAVDGQAALCNIFFHNPDDADWAMETWHSLTCRRSASEQ